MLKELSIDDRHPATPAARGHWGRSPPPQSLCIHCLAYCFDLVIREVISTNSLFTKPMQICHDLYAFIGVSPKRILIFEKFQEEISKGDDETTQKLQCLSVTRWTARGRAAKVILDTRETLVKVLLDIHNYASVNGLARSKAKKLEKGLRALAKYLAWYSRIACFCINKVKERVKQLRQDVEFERMYEIVEKMGFTYDVSTGRRKVPKRSDDSEVLEGLDTTVKISHFFLQTKLKLNANASK